MVADGCSRRTWMSVREKRRWTRVPHATENATENATEKASSVQNSDTEFEIVVTYLIFTRRCSECRMPQTRNILTPNLKGRRHQIALQTRTRARTRLTHSSYSLDLVKIAFDTVNWSMCYYKYLPLTESNTVWSKVIEKIYLDVVHHITFDLESVKATFAWINILCHQARKAAIRLQYFSSLSSKQY